MNATQANEINYSGGLDLHLSDALDPEYLETEEVDEEFLDTPEVEDVELMSTAERQALNAKMFDFYFG